MASRASFLFLHAVPRAEAELICRSHIFTRLNSPIGLTFLVTSVVVVVRVLTKPIDSVIIKYIKLTLRIRGPIHNISALFQL